MTRHIHGGLMVQTPDAGPLKRHCGGKLDAVEVQRDELVRNTLPCPTCGRPAGRRCDYGIADPGTRKPINGTGGAPKQPVINPVHTRRYLDGIAAGLVPPLPAMTTLNAIARSAY
jgi:hypothetical protein